MQVAEGLGENVMLVRVQCGWVFLLLLLLFFFFFKGRGKRREVRAWRDGKDGRWLACGECGSCG